MPKQVCYTLQPWDQRGGVGFLYKSILFFFPLGHHLGRWEYFELVPHRCGETLIVFQEFIPKLCKKNQFCFWNFRKFLPKPLQAAKRTHVFSGGLALPVARRVQRVQSKFQGSLREAHEERPKRVCYSTWPWGRGEELGFCPKVTMLFSPVTSFGLAGVLLISAPSSQGGYDSFFGNLFQNYE